MRSLLLSGSVLGLILCSRYLGFNSLADTKTEINHVLVNVLVTDKDGRPVTDLTWRDFSIAEDGVEQQIDHFAYDRDGMSATFILAFQFSDFEPFRPMAQRAAWSVIKQLRSIDDMTISQLGVSRETAAAFSSDTQKPTKIVREFSITDKSPLADILAAGSKAANQKAKMRRVPIVITDGLELAGEGNDQDVAYRILRENMPLYFIVLADGRFSSRPGAHTSLRQRMNLLARIAAVSGGQVFVVKKQDEIPVVGERIFQRLNSQCIIGYSPTNGKWDGSFRYFRVSLIAKDKRDLKITTPLGYYAPVETVANDLNREKK